MNDLEKFGKYMIAEITTEGNIPKIVDRHHRGNKCQYPYTKERTKWFFPGAYYSYRKEL
jgi:hypothetical protein